MVVENLRAWIRQNVWTKLEADARYYSRAAADVLFAAHAALTAAHGATGAVVGTTNTQTLTGKTLTSPIIDTSLAVTGTATFTGAVSETAVGSDNVRIGVLAGTPRVVLEDASGAQWEIDNNAGTLRLFQPGVVKATVDSSGNLLLVGTLTTAANVAWNLGAYSAGAPTPTGYLTVTVAGATYRIAVEAV